jgi:hypothetical protein
VGVVPRKPKIENGISKSEHENDNLGKTGVQPGTRREVRETCCFLGVGVMKNMMSIRGNWRRKKSSIASFAHVKWKE